jgi:hypothetical protein
MRAKSASLGAAWPIGRHPDAVKESAQISVRD